MYINELQNLNLNIGLFYNGKLNQTNSSDYQRSYYFNEIEYRQNQNNSALKQTPDQKHYWVEGKSASFSQSQDLTSWAKVKENESLKEALYYSSALAFITQPIWFATDSTMQVPNGKTKTVPKQYISFVNGLQYDIIKYMNTSKFEEIEKTAEVDPECAQVVPTITNPDPFRGYDVRCRQWF